MNDTTTNSPPTSVSFWHALSFWFKLGLISFGGPAGQIAIMHQELVERRRWLSEKRFLHALNYCMLLPGPEAQQLATYIGWLLHKTRGGIIAGVLFILPSLVLLIALGWIYLRFGNSLVVAGIFYGIKPAVAAIVVQAAYRIGSRVLKNSWLWVIAAAAFIAIFFFKVPFPLIVLSAGIIGWLGSRYSPTRFQSGQTHTGTATTTFAALIDDHTPTPEHARYKTTRLIKTILVGILLWLVPMCILLITVGWQHLFTQMSWFFTTAALLTFGGAYAVLPYVYQGAVTHYQWVTPTQMIDGLALGETTPGPLIMVVTFVGFLGGYQAAMHGGESLFLTGLIAALLVTWFTFLPSFIFILAGGPLVESTHGKSGFTAPLTGITAAVVGVILNLALFFAYHALWPNGFEHNWFTSLDLFALTIGLLACFLLFYLRLSVIKTIFLCGAIGLMLQFFIRF